MMRMPWHGKYVPHATLDILRGCNCVCPYCYNVNRGIVLKPFDEVCRELDALLRLRRLQTVTLSGGEPLLHPDVCRIVREIHRRGICVSILSNGVLLDDTMAERLRQAGCDLMMLHIQYGQGRPDALTQTVAQAEELRAGKGIILKRHGIVPAFVMTLEAVDVAGFCESAHFLRQSDVFEFLLVTVARDFHALANTHSVTRDVDEKTILNALEQNGFRPFSFVGGRLNKRHPRWYIFHSVSRANRQGQCTGWQVLRASVLERIFLTLNRWVKGRSVFLEKSSSAKIKARLLGNALTGGFMSGFLFAARAIFRGEKLQDKHIVVQLPPFRLPDGRLEWCDDCPDATLKDGVLHPLCLSDVAPHECLTMEDAL